MRSLETMLSMQRDFQVRLNPNFMSMTVPERVAFIKEHSIHLNQEINEMLYELPYFKPWKDYSSVDDNKEAEMLAKARMECIDAWHFFMNIMIALGFSVDEFTDMYMAKNKENHRRQDDGYTADKSYRDQPVEEVMSKDVKHPFGSADYVLDKVKCPQFGDTHYGDWGALNIEQRCAIKRLAEHDKHVTEALDALLKKQQEVTTHE